MLIFCDLQVVNRLTSGHTELSLSFVAFLRSLVGKWIPRCHPGLVGPPPYRSVPGVPVYHVGLDDGTVVLVAGHDLGGVLLDLVTAVLALGEAV
jgi:hypothetical protein